MLGVLITEAEPCGCTVENPKGVFLVCVINDFSDFLVFFKKN